MIVKNPEGYTIRITAQPPASGLLPLGTVVVSSVMVERDRGMVIGYNADKHHTFYDNGRYPYVILWEDGYFEVYGPVSLQEAA
jgi:hypothetical protein